MATSKAGPTLAALRKILNREPPKRAGEVCEMCAAAIPEPHSHVVNTETRTLLCTCRYCYLLFTREGAARGKFRAVPERYRYDPGFTLTDAQWERFQIPVRMAFFFVNSKLGHVVAFYPSPAGATESTLELESWHELVGANPILSDMQPDVEALLVYGARGARFQCFIVPIDACYELTGRVKRTWRGFDGGDAARTDIDRFFRELRDKSRAVDEMPPGGRDRVNPPAKGGSMRAIQ
jgi:hypothetical protein